MLLEQGHDINSKDEFGFTALMTASANGNIEMINFLLANGKANINTQCNDGHTALIYACNENKYEPIEILLSYGAGSIESLDGLAALRYAKVIQLLEMKLTAQ